MTSRSTFTAVSTAGRKGSVQEPNKPNANRGRWFQKTLTFTPPLVPNITSQRAGVFLPAHAVVTNVFINVITPESTGATPLLDIGTVANATTALVPNANVSSAGLINPTPGSAREINTANDEVTYTLGSNDWVEFDGEVVIEYIGTDEI